MVESRLPPAVLGKATLRGSEYAWAFADVPEAIVAAREVGLATVGGVAQFRIPEGTCELYWRCADARERKPGEQWNAYADRSADEVTAGVRALPVSELVAEGVQWKEIAALCAAGVDVTRYLCFVLYFDAPDTEPSAAPDPTG
jgi:hypothetical protein